MRNFVMEHMGGTARIQSRQLVIRVCVARLIVLLLLLLPLGLSWPSHPMAPELPATFQETGYQVFLVAGFVLTIFFLLTWQVFSNLILFFQLQLTADLLLVFFLILITGALKSGFAFIGLALIFLYGRVLGMRAATCIAACLAAFYLTLGGLQSLRFFYPLPLSQTCLYTSLHLLDLALMLILVRMHTGRMDQLVHEMAERERRLRRSEALKTKVMDWMSSGLLIVNDHGLISSINIQALHWAGLQDMDQGVGRPLREIYPGLYVHWEAWDQGEPKRIECRRENRLFGATLTLLPEDQGTLILFTDITRIRELEARVQEMEKMATVGELAAGLAHEIKNPLAGIRASLQLLPSNSLPEAKRQRLFQVVERDVQRLNHLLSNFLAFARPEQASPQKVNLAETVHSCLLTLNTNYPHISFEVDPGLNGHQWSWDRDHLHQVLLNLLMNAAQAATQADTPKVDIHWGASDTGQYISIADNGPGVDPSIQNKMFDPFTTTKNHGSGLGLSIAQRLAHQNQSWIEIGPAPSPAGGTRACIYTPHPDHTPDS